MRNINLGAGRRDIVLFAGATALAILVTLLWNLFLVDPISNFGSYCQRNSQICNKYFLTVVIFGIAVVTTALSIILARRVGGLATRHTLIAGTLVRFGLALQLLGILITPIGLFYATNPTRSVPVGFTFFTTVFLGIWLAGIGGNMLRPRRA